MAIAASLIDRPSWKTRRLIIIVALLFCAFNITWTNIVGGDVSIATALIYAATGIIGTYVFGAAWDDNNFMKAQINQQAALPDATVDDLPTRRRGRKIGLEPDNAEPPENPQGITEG